MINKVILYFNQVEYCLFLDRNTLGEYLPELINTKFKFKTLVIDQLFYTGEKNNRFVSFDVLDGKIQLNSAKKYKFSSEIKKIINNYICNNYSDYCKAYLNNFDYDKICKNCLKV